MKSRGMHTVFRGSSTCLRRSHWMSLGCCLVLMSFEPAPAIEGDFRVSEFDGAIQIWFEAENFDERIPDTDQYFPIVDADGALNGRAMSREGGTGGCIRWDFDIGAAGGLAGEWYMWGRVVNPENRSDFVLVEGDPGDLEIPDEEPYPGGSGTPPFVDADDRAFEDTLGNCAVLSPDYADCTWGWIGGATQGHIKELRDGENSMFLFDRQGNNTRLVDVILWTNSSAYRPNDGHYLAARSMNPEPCEQDPDTHCFGMTVEGPPDGTAGRYTVTARAEDDGDEPFLYILTADNGVDPPTTVTSTSEVLEVLLPPGTWTISVTVDDDIDCDDEAADATCVEGPFEVLPVVIETRPRPETPFRVSQFEDAVQIWFEAEDFQERLPDDDTFFPVVAADGAFRDEAVTRAGGAGGRLRWDFDISAAGGEAGRWYMWGRVVNPENRSDYLLVEGDTGDLEIPDEAPFPGGNGSPPFVNDDDRVFESGSGDCAFMAPEYAGCTWGWIGGMLEGHDKELHDGVNSMFLFHREGDDRRLLDVVMWTNSSVYEPSDEHYAAAVEFVDDPRPPFHRGDADSDGAVNITDAVSILNFLFSGGPDATCKEAQDVDNDGAVIITDAVAILGFLFGSAAPPAPPGPTTEPCGSDPDAPGSPGDLGCTAYSPCAG